MLLLLAVVVKIPKPRQAFTLEHRHQETAQRSVSKSSSLLNTSVVTYAQFLSEIRNHVNFPLVKITSTNNKY